MVRLKPRGGIPSANHRHARHQGRLKLSVFNLCCLLKGRGGFIVPPRGIQGQAEIELPLRLLRVQGQRATQLRLGLFPAAGFVVLVSTLNVLLCLEPFAHRRPPRHCPFCPNPGTRRSATLASSYHPGFGLEWTSFGSSALSADRTRHRCSIVMINMKARPQPVGPRALLQRRLRS